MDHNEQLHEAIVDISRGCRLQDEDVFIAHGLADRDTSLPVRVVEAHCVGDIDAQPIAASAQVPEHYFVGRDRKAREANSPQRHHREFRTYRLATLALSSGWELPDMSLISFAIWSNMVEAGAKGIFAESRQRFQSSTA